MKIIGLCGKLGSGKDTFADYLVRKHKFVKITMSDMIVHVMKGQGINDFDRYKIQMFSKEYKEKYGKDIWAKVCLEYAQKNQLRRVVISGMRDTSELKFLRTLEKDFVLVCVIAEQEVRFQRAKTRKSMKDVEILSDFIKQEVNEAKLFDLYETCDKFSDYTIDNNHTQLELYAAAEALLKQLNW